jgi:hypothetical protein
MNKRTRTTKHFIKNDNSASAFISPSSIHYMDAANNWIDINTDIVSNVNANSSTHPYSSEHNSVKTYFPSNPFTNYVLMSAKEGNFKERVSSIKLLDASKNLISTLALSNNVTSVINGNKITYSGFYSGLSLNYSLYNDSRKFDLIINSANFLNSLPANASYIVIDEEFISMNANSLITTQENKITVNVNGTEVFNFSQPVAFDSNTSKEASSDGTISFSKNGTSYSLLTSFDLNWLKSNSRIFPIHLDPIINYYPMNTAMWTGYQTSNANKTSGFLRLTDNTTACWAKFDLSTLPVGAAIIQATYYGNHYTTTNVVPKLAEIRGLGSLDPVPAAAAALFTATYGGSLYATSYTFGAGTFGWNTSILNATAQNDIAAAVGNWIALGLSYLSGTTTFMYQYGINGTSVQLCYLEINYSLTPCTLVPGANSVVSPTFVLCPNAPINLSLLNTYTVSGISYQWQSSTVSFAGPFTSISGATNTSYSTNAPNITTWFSPVITCTNASGSAAITAGTINIATTVTNSIPYADSFENVFVNNNLPNCSWSASSPGGACRTYTTAQLNNRIPKSGNKFGTFAAPTSTNGDYFYTNGLQLEPGITYSTAIWYITDGNLGWSELSLMLGTSQSTTGLTNIGSLVGPAGGQFYQLLSGTLTVPTSGLYYVAIKCVGSSSAQFLTIDDLSITIPCSLNSPMLNVSASSTTICRGSSMLLSATGANTYLWNTASSSSTINVSPLVSSVYTVTGTNTLTGCASGNSILINVKPSPNAVLFVATNTVCLGQFVILYGFGGNNYSWSNGGSGSSIVVSPTANTNYSVIVTDNNGCSSTATTNISVKPLPQVFAQSSNSGTLCLGDNVTLIASGAGLVTYTWSSNNINVTAQQAIVSPNVSTIYTLSATNSDGCTNKATISQFVDACTSISKNTNELNNLKVLPNPTIGKFIIKTGTSSDKTIVISDLTGRIISILSSSEENIEFNLTNVANGIYYAKVSSQNANKVVKIIKE